MGLAFVFWSDSKDLTIFLGIIRQRMSSNDLRGKERRVTQEVQTVRVSALREAPVMGKRASEWTRRLWG